MVTVNIHEAKTQLSRLVDEAAKGETVVIAKAGKRKGKGVDPADVIAKAAEAAEVVDAEVVEAETVDA